jgi:Cu+-exporting ATPase
LAKVLFVYNTLGIPLGAGLFYPFLSLVVSPELAGAFMAVSSISVTLNTLLLKRFHPTLRHSEDQLIHSREAAKAPLSPVTVTNK